MHDGRPYPASARIIFGLSFVYAMTVATAADAHLMVSQYGTLNFKSSGTFVVVSLPVSAFVGVDDDGDGQLSETELQRHHGELVTQGVAGFHLLDSRGPLALEGVLFNLSAPHGKQSTADHVVMMGRFAPSADSEGYRSRTSLFGTGDGEDSLRLMVRRDGETQAVLLTESSPDALVFAGVWQRLMANVTVGFDHVVFGFDHVLFLLVVLAGGWRLQEVFWTLTVFTVGHALSLGATWLGHVQVSPGVVEPAIALTIVLVAVLDARARVYGASFSGAKRMALVFFCAGIHGLGLAGSLGELELQGEALFYTLLGFNAGVELGQVCVAGFALGALWFFKRRSHPVAYQLGLNLLAACAACIGAAWFLMRVFGV